MRLEDACVIINKDVQMYLEQLHFTYNKNGKYYEREFILDNNNIERQVSITVYNDKIVGRVHDAKIIGYVGVAYGSKDLVSYTLTGDEALYEIKEMLEECFNQLSSRRD